MRLVAIDYWQHEGTDRQWALKGLGLGPVNLVVGKNASGKSWTLNIIAGLARLLAGDQKVAFQTGHYVATFEDAGRELRYELHVEGGVVVCELLQKGDDRLLTRGSGGQGTIRAEQLEGTNQMKFQTPPEELAVVARRDTLQHPFLEPLHQWGSQLYYYPFGTPLGKDNFGIFVQDAPPPNPKNPQQVVGIFAKAVNEHGDAYKRLVLDDLDAIGYPATAVLTCPASISVPVALPGPAVWLAVAERGLSAPTEQNEMSQGMFRALSLLIQLNYGVVSGHPSTVVIDDIGEGLDFERSCQLINLVMEKAAAANIQLIMATNDRFVMNRVPLTAWSVLRRIPGGSSVANYLNSRELFDAFAHTGLNNFDFLASDFLSFEDAADA